MKSFRPHFTIQRLEQLAPHSTLIGQFSLILYFISPTLTHIGWLYALVSTLVVTGLMLSMGALFALFRRDKLQLFQILMNRDPKERIYDGMISLVGFLIGTAYHDYAVLFVSVLTGFDFMSGHLLRKRHKRW